jgi:predicted component of type VI protein secretion system
MAEHLVSLRLVSGESKHSGFTLSSRQDRAMFRVGAALECNWRIYGAGVALHHCLLMWNGRDLTVVDVGAGDLWVDETRVSGTAVVHSGRIRFGSATIVVDSAFGGALTGERPRVQFASEDSLALTTWFPGASAPAPEPKRRSERPPLRSLCKALVLGLALGAGLAILKNHLA